MKSWRIFKEKYMTYDSFPEPDFFTPILADAVITFVLILSALFAIRLLEVLI